MTDAGANLTFNELAGPDSRAVIHAFPFNSLGLQSAITAAARVGRPATVILAGVPYALDQDVTLACNVSVKGELGAFDYQGYVPDENPTPTTGTILNLAPGVTGLKYSNVDQPNPVPAELADTAGTGINIEGITFVGGLRAIHTGAKNILGLHFGKVKNCRFFNQSAEHYIFENFMHMEFKNLWAWNSLPNVVAGGCVYRASRLRKADNSLGLIPGNSVWLGTIFGWTNQFLGRGIELRAIDGQLNECSLAAARIQFNRHGVETVPYDIVLSANSTANFLVADNAQFALCQVGMPLVIPTGSAAVAGVSSGVVYFVSSRNTSTNEITLNEILYRTTSNLVASATTTVTMKCGGFPGLVAAGDETGQISASDFGRLDLECRGNAVSAVFQRTAGDAKVLEVSTSATNTMFAARLARTNVSHSGESNITNDFSTLMGGFKVTNTCPATGGFNTSITLNSSHSGAHWRSTNGAPFNVTVPKELPAGFEFAFTIATANAGTLVQGSNVNIAKTAASLVSSNVVGATVRLRQISVNTAGMSYSATGDLI